MSIDSAIGRSIIESDLAAFRFPAHTPPLVVRSGPDVAHLPPSIKDLKIREEEYARFIAASYYANSEEPEEAIKILTDPNRPVPKLSGAPFRPPSPEPPPRRAINIKW